MRATFHAQLDDEALVAGVVAEDGDAATEFVRRFQAKVFGVALAVTRDPALAADVAQDAFVRAWRSAATFDGRRGSVSAWLLTITRNAGIDAVRARRQMPADADQLDQLLHAALGPGDATDQVDARVDAAPVLARLRALPPGQARAVTLAVLAGCTAGEIADREGIPLGTAKTRIRDGLRRLRRDQPTPSRVVPTSTEEGRG